MNFEERPYQTGDEVSINSLYAKITGRVRNFQQYKWEWLETWNGQGKIWLAFDRDREKDDQLILQYSLIPIPFSVFGRSFLAGKTENCMSHPDCRGQKYFFPHEKKYFEKAKREFQIFYTTAGNVAKGAVGGVRRKLGYKAFDSWTTMYFITNTRKTGVVSEFRNKKKISRKIIYLLRLCVLLPLQYYCCLFQPRQFNFDFKIFNKNDVPLNNIECLWKENKKFYGITVERTTAYLNWRINENPYLQHKYLTYWKDDVLKGYLIFHLENENTIKIVDIFVQGKEKRLFEKIIKNLIYYAKSKDIGKISCVTSSGNWFLRKIFYSCGFLTPLNIRKIIRFEFNKELSRKRPFHVFVSDNILAIYPNAFKRSEWYMTGLVFEGIKYD